MTAAKAQVALFDMGARIKRDPVDVRVRLELRQLARRHRELERADERTRCPACGCTASSPRCTIVLGDEHGTAACVPRGVLGLKRCSRCL